MLQHPERRRREGGHVHHEHDPAGGRVGDRLKSWLAACTCLHRFALPALTISAGIFIYFVQTAQTTNSNAYAKAGAKAEQATNAVRTIKSLGGEEFELKNYSVHLTEAYSKIIKVMIFAGTGYGFVFFSVFAQYALAFWYGAHLMKAHDYNSLNEQYTSGDIFIVFFSVFDGRNRLGPGCPLRTLLRPGPGVGLKGVRDHRQSARHQEQPKWSQNPHHRRHPLQKRRVRLPHPSGHAGSEGNQHPHPQVKEDGARGRKWVRKEHVHADDRSLLRHCRRLPGD